VEDKNFPSLPDGPPLSFKTNKKKNKKKGIPFNELEESKGVDVMEKYRQAAEA